MALQLTPQIAQMALNTPESAAQRRMHQNAPRNAQIRADNEVGEAAAQMDNWLDTNYTRLENKTFREIQSEFNKEYNRIGGTLGSDARSIWHRGKLQAQEMAMRNFLLGGGNTAINSATSPAPQPSSAAAGNLSKSDYLTPAAGAAPQTPQGGNPIQSERLTPASGAPFMPVRHSPALQPAAPQTPQGGNPIQSERLTPASGAPQTPQGGNPIQSERLTPATGAPSMPVRRSPALQPAVPMEEIPPYLAADYAALLLGGSIALDDYEREKEYEKNLKEQQMMIDAFSDGLSAELLGAGQPPLHRPQGGNPIQSERLTPASGVPQTPQGGNPIQYERLTPASGAPQTPQGGNPIQYERLTPASGVPQTPQGGGAVNTGNGIVVGGAYPRLDELPPIEKTPANETPAPVTPAQNVAGGGGVYQPEDAAAQNPNMQQLLNYIAANAGVGAGIGQPAPPLGNGLPNINQRRMMEYLARYSPDKLVQLAMRQPSAQAANRFATASFGDNSLIYDQRTGQVHSVWGGGAGGEISAEDQINNINNRRRLKMLNAGWTQQGIDHISELVGKTEFQQIANYNENYKRGLRILTGEEDAGGGNRSFVQDVLPAIVATQVGRNLRYLPTGLWGELRKSKGNLIERVIADVKLLLTGDLSDHHKKQYAELLRNALQTNNSIVANQLGVNPGSTSYNLFTQSEEARKALRQYNAQLYDIINESIEISGGGGGGGSPGNLTGEQMQQRMKGWEALAGMTDEEIESNAADLQKQWGNLNTEYTLEDALNYMRDMRARAARLLEHEKARQKGGGSGATPQNDGYLPDGYLPE